MTHELPDNLEAVVVHIKVSIDRLRDIYQLGPYASYNDNCKEFSTSIEWAMLEPYQTRSKEEGNFPFHCLLFNIRGVKITGKHTKKPLYILRLLSPNYPAPPKANLSWAVVP